MTATGLAGRLALNAIVGVVVVSVMAIVEEIGWRAWLLPPTSKRGKGAPARGADGEVSRRGEAPGG